MPFLKAGEKKKNEIRRNCVIFRGGFEKQKNSVRYRLAADTHASPCGWLVLRDGDKIPARRPCGYFRRPHELRLLNSLKGRANPAFFNEFARWASWALPAFNTVQ